MRRLIGIFLAAIFICSAFAGCAASGTPAQEPAAQGQQDQQQGDTQPSSGQEQQTSAAAELSDEQAKKIVLEDAGLSEADISQLRISREREDGVRVIDLTFYAGPKKYDYELNAASGEIRSMDMEQQPTSAPGGTAAISEADAKRIVQEQLPGVTETDIRLHLEQDDGRPVYEGEVFYQQSEYNFTIDAVDGTLLDWEMERVGRG